VFFLFVGGATGGNEMDAGLFDVEKLAIQFVAGIHRRMVQLCIAIVNTFLRRLQSWFDVLSGFQKYFYTLY
jgi:hypothetical protein